MTIYEALDLIMQVSVTLVTILTLIVTIIVYINKK